MIRIEQVRLLEERVQKVIARITELKAENSALHNQLENYQERISDLERRIEGFASNQEEIEAGILSALQRLDEVEDAVGEEGIEQQQVEVIPEEDASAGTSEPPVDGDTREESADEDLPPDQEEEQKPGPELDIF
ncbi:MAG: cell division protein ZapB [Spirochaetaceae bacterium]|nr:MAG: cell division protein ZapB [Spirochaetaceae bacterium]